jgi:hypothetical protein
VSQSLAAAPALSRNAKVSSQAAASSALAASTAVVRRVDGSQLVVDAGDGAPRRDTHGLNSQGGQNSARPDLARVSG